MSNSRGRVRHSQKKRPLVRPYLTQDFLDRAQQPAKPGDYATVKPVGAAGTAVMVNSASADQAESFGPFA